MYTKGNALYLQLGSMTRARRGCSAVRSPVPCPCACCVWSRCLGLTEHTRQQMPVEAAIFSAILSLLLHYHLWYCHSMCLLYLPVVPCFSCTLICLEEAQKFGRKSGSCLFSAECPTLWSFFPFGTVGLDVEA